MDQLAKLGGFASFASILKTEFATNAACEDKKLQILLDDGQVLLLSFFLSRTGQILPKPCRFLERPILRFWRALCQRLASTRRF
jgi:hypothetical protein